MDLTPEVGIGVVTTAVEIRTHDGGQPYPGGCS
jgi:hypothetical protein